MSDYFCSHLMKRGLSSGHLNAVSTKVRKTELNYTYSDILAMICLLCKELSSRQSRPQAIGIFSTRCVETYVAVAACLFLKIKFVPLNPKFPAERLKKIISAGQVETVFTDAKSTTKFDFHDVPAVNVAEFLENIDSENAESVLADLNRVLNDNSQVDSDPAYHMFTSGSTGEPKGVPISYANLDSYLEGIISELPFEQGQRFSQFFDLSFDLSLHDILVCLSTGGVLVPASDMDMLMPHRYVDSKKIDVWFSVPMLALPAYKGVETAPIAHKLQLALFCGEPLPMNFVQQFKQLVVSSGKIFNLYGPTEATIAFTSRDVTDLVTTSGPAPLGKSFGENEVGILDESGEVAQIFDAVTGVEGELVLGGPQVFTGYVPKTGIQSFVEASDKRYYKSGDLVRFDGTELHHLGRTDSQVKIRGFRVELGEIERAFTTVFGCEAAVAVDFVKDDIRSVFLAYVGETEVEDVTALLNLIPEYMVPAVIKKIDLMPLNENGKIKRNEIREMI